MEKTELWDMQEGSPSAMDMAVRKLKIKKKLEKT